MPGIMPLFGQPQASMQQLSDAERREFDEITYDKIQAMADLKKLAKLEAYMRAEGFAQTAEVAHKKLLELGGEPPKTPVPEKPVDVDAELDTFLKELNQWEAKVKGADGQLKSSAPAGGALPSPAVRRKVGGKVGQAGLVEEAENLKPKNAREVVEKAKKMKEAKDLRSGTAYYKKWDQYADEAEKEIETETVLESAKSEQVLKGQRGSTTATPEEDVLTSAEDKLVASASKLPQVEREWMAKREREKGNEFFKGQEYSASISAYTLALQLDPNSAPAYANRAAAYLKLKKWEEAEMDSSRALALEKSYVKALLRRATARLELDHPRGALEDASAALALEPSNKELLAIHTRAQKAVSKLSDVEKQTDVKKPMKRMLIEEVEGDSEGLPDERQVPVGQEEEESADVSREGDADVSTLDPADVSRNCEVPADGSPADVSTPAGIRTQQTETPADASTGPSASVSPDASADVSTSDSDESVEEESPEVASEKLRELGNEVFRQGSLEAAEECYSRSVACNPANVLALNNRALCRNKLGQYSGAWRDAAVAILLEPGNVKAYHRRAVALKGLGRREEALRDLQVVQRLLPSYPSVQAEIQQLQHEIEEEAYIPPRSGAAVFEEVDEDDEQKPSEEEFQANYEAAAKEAMEAKEFKRQLEERAEAKERRKQSRLARDEARRNKAAAAAAGKGDATAGNGDATAGKSDTTAGKGDTAAGSGPAVTAASSQSQAESTPSTSASGNETAERLKEEGNALFGRGDVAGALSCYNRSLELRGNDARVFCNRAMCHLQLGDFVSAEADSSAALGLDPSYVKAYHRRAKARRQLGRLEEALEDLQEVVAALPGSAQVLDEISAGERELKSQREKVEAGAEEGKKVNGTAQQEGNVIWTAQQNKSQREKVKGQEGKVKVDKSQNVNAQSQAQNLTPVTAGKVNGQGQKVQEGDSSEVKPQSQPKKSTPVTAGNLRSVMEMKADAAAAVLAKRGLKEGLAKVPKSALEFERACQGLMDSQEALAAYVKALDPLSYPQIFKDCLTGTALGYFALALQPPELPESPERALEIIRGLPKISRFGVTAMLLGQKEKSALASAFQKLQESGCSEAELAPLRKEFRLK